MRMDIKKISPKKNPIYKKAGGGPASAKKVLFVSTGKLMVEFGN